MKKILRWLLLPLVLILLLLVVVIGINAFDESLNEKAAAMGEPRAPGVADAQNGYLAVIAMGAGDGGDSLGYAQAWLAEARAAAKENRAENKIEVKRAERPALCDAVQTSCLAAVQNKADSISVQLDAYKEDLTRYERLITYQAYEEILDYRVGLASQFPRYAPMIAAQRAWIVRAALAAETGKLDDALAAVERDIAFQRVMLAGSRTLIGRMVAAGNYTRDLAFLADLLQTSLDDLKPYAPRLIAMLKPINPAALNMDVLIEAEFGAIKQALTMPAVASSVGQGAFYSAIGVRLFYQPNATINAAHAHYTQTRDQLRKPPAQLMHESATEAATPEGMQFWDYFVNPVGKVLTRIAIPSFSSYALRLHDLDAYNRLLGLAAEIIAADVGKEGVADFVAKSDARFFDPYSGKPMAWDAATSQLSFKASDALAKRKLFNLENGRVFLRM